MQYVVHKRYRGLCLSGEANLPYGATCELNGEIIEKDGRPLVLATSENAHLYFARNDDGNGLRRGELTREIIAKLEPPPERRGETATQNKKRKEEIAKQIAAWERIWNDPRIQPYKMREHADHWLWNHAFFNAEIETLEYILGVIKGGAPCTK